MSGPLTYWGIIFLLFGVFDFFAILLFGFIIIGGVIPFVIAAAIASPILKYIERGRRDKMAGQSLNIVLPLKSKNFTINNSEIRQVSFGKNGKSFVIETYDKKYNVEVSSKDTASLSLLNTIPNFKEKLLPEIQRSPTKTSTSIPKDDSSASSFSTETPRLIGSCPKCHFGDSNLIKNNSEENIFKCWNCGLEYGQKRFFPYHYFRVNRRGTRSRRDKAIIAIGLIVIAIAMVVLVVTLLGILSNSNSFPLVTSSSSSFTLTTPTPQSTATLTIITKSTIELRIVQAQGGSTNPRGVYSLGPDSSFTVSANAQQGYSFKCWIYDIDYGNSAEINSTSSSISVSGNVIYLNPVFGQ